MKIKLSKDSNIVYVNCDSSTPHVVYQFTDRWRNAHLISAPTHEEAQSAFHLYQDQRMWLYIEDIGEWSVNNFGVQPAINRIAGMAEEIGELIEKPLDAADAVSDILIYFMDYCYASGITELMYDPETIRDIHVAFGKLAHCTLKTVQKIRGFADPAFARTMTEQAAICFYTSLLHHNKWYTQQMLDEVVAEVLKRDWTKKPEDAHVNP